MLLSRILLVFLIISFISQYSLGQAKSLPIYTKLDVYPKIVPLINTNIKEDSLKSDSEVIISYAEVCTCYSYYGVPHSCYYSPVYDPDFSCVSKCLREANG